MDAVAKYLDLLNTVALSSATARVNPAAGGALSVAAGIDRVDLKAGDGALEGMVFEDLDFGVERVLLPSSSDPSLRVVPVLNHAVLSFAPALFKRLASVLKEPLAGRAGELFDRVVVDGVRASVRLEGKVLDLDLEMEKKTVLRGEKVGLTVSDLSLSVQGFDLSNKDRKAALADSLVVIHRLRVEVEEEFLNRAVQVGKAKAPEFLKDLKFELPGRKMVVTGEVSKGVSISFRVDLRLETWRNLFGIYFDRFFLPGTNIGLPGFVRNRLLGVIRMMEDKFHGLVEVSDDKLLINPWPRIPVPVECRVERFEVENGKIVVGFGPVPGVTPEREEAPQDGPEARAAGPEDAPESDEAAADRSDETRDAPVPMMPPGPPSP